MRLDEILDGRMDGWMLSRLIAHESLRAEMYCQVLMKRFMQITPSGHLLVTTTT